MTPNLSAHLRESPVDALTQMSNAPRMGKPDTQIGALGEETLERSSAAVDSADAKPDTQMSNAPVFLPFDPRWGGVRHKWLKPDVPPGTIALPGPRANVAHLHASAIYFSSATNRRM